LIEIISQCPTNFGRRAIGSGEAIDGVEWIAANSISLPAADALPEHELAAKFVTGIFVNQEKAVFAGSSVDMGCQEG
jgi:2-oxoglutarate ferredoxin oxidoreductase subunit beta